MRAFPHISLAGGYNYLRYKVSKKTPVYNLSSFRPILLTLVVNRVCNLTCPFCFASNTSAEEGKEYEGDVESVRKLLSLPVLKRVIMVGLTGGEPMLNKNLTSIIKMIRGQGRFVILVTHGLLLKKRIKELEKTGLSLLSLSLYDETMDDLASDLANFRTNLLLRTTKVILREDLENNPEKIERCIEFSKNLGATGITLQIVMKRSNDDTSDIIYDDCEAYFSFKKQMEIKYPDFQIDWPNPLKRKIFSSDKACKQPWFAVVSDIKGNSGLCCNYYPQGDDSYGNLFSGEPLQNSSAINTQQKLRLRQGLLDREDKVPSDCKNCYTISDGWLSDY